MFCQWAVHSFCVHVHNVQQVSMVKVLWSLHRMESLSMAAVWLSVFHLHRLKYIMCVCVCVSVCETEVCVYVSGVCCDDLLFSMRACSCVV